jgi:hypothetical protein
LSNFFFSKKPGICSFLTLFYDSRYPLIDGTFFLSPRQHTKACIQVEIIISTPFLKNVNIQGISYANSDGIFVQTQIRNNVLLKCHVSGEYFQVYQNMKFFPFFDKFLLYFFAL